MNIIIALLIVDTIVQAIVCKPSLWLFICIVGRLLFSLRIVGATFKVKHLCIVEAVAFCSALLWNMLVHKGSVPWVALLLFLLFCLVASALMLIDDLFYVYYTDDDDEIEISTKEGKNG